MHAPWRRSRCELPGRAPRQGADRSTTGPFGATRRHTRGRADADPRQHRRHARRDGLAGERAVRDASSPSVRWPPRRTTRRRTRLRSRSRSSARPPGRCAARAGCRSRSHRSVDDVAATDVVIVPSMAMRRQRRLDPGPLPADRRLAPRDARRRRDDLLGLLGRDADRGDGPARRARGDGPLDLRGGVPQSPPGRACCASTRRWSSRATAAAWSPRARRPPGTTWRCT